MQPPEMLQLANRPEPPASPEGVPPSSAPEEEPDEDPEDDEEPDELDDPDEDPEDELDAPEDEVLEAPEELDDAPDDELVEEPPEELDDAPDDELVEEPPEELDDDPDPDDDVPPSHGFELLLEHALRAKSGAMTTAGARSLRTTTGTSVRGPPSQEACPVADGREDGRGARCTGKVGAILYGTRPAPKHLP
jgi:hypothetical protein